MTKIICIDFDGTLHDGYYPVIGKPNLPLIGLMHQWRAQGYELIVNSSRQSLDYQKIKKFLETYQVPYDQLQIGLKVVADVYIDDRGLYPPPHILEAFVEQKNFIDPLEYYDAVCSEKLSSAFARNLREVPEAGFAKKTDESFMIGLPITGGLDSITLWNMLEEAGQPYRMFFFDFGHVYADGELQAIREITGREPEIYTHTMPFEKHDYILSGRNAAILLWMAQELTRNQGWGEIWFGNVAGESPKYGGDKSKRFFNDIAALFALKGLDVRLTQPLVGLDKTDIVRYWQHRDINVLKATKSCFAPGRGACGECQACFRKWAAFVAAGVDVSDIFPPEKLKFDKFTLKYQMQFNSAITTKDFDHYALNRIHHDLEALEAYRKIKHES